MDFSLITTVAEIANFLGILGACNNVSVWLDSDLEATYYREDDLSFVFLAKVQINRRVME